MHPLLRSFVMCDAGIDGEEEGARVPGSIWRGRLQRVEEIPALTRLRAGTVSRPGEVETAPELLIRLIRCFGDIAGLAITIFNIGLLHRLSSLVSTSEGTLAICISSRFWADLPWLLSAGKNAGPKLTLTLQGVDDTTRFDCVVCFGYLPKVASSQGQSSTQASPPTTL